MKKFFEEFKTFISKGNVLDMAVGVIVGAAFGAITTALVGNIITPLLAWAFGAPNTDALNITLREAVMNEAGEVTQEALVLGLGTFVGAIINFLIVALVLFADIKAFNQAREMAEKKEEVVEEAPAEDPKPTSEELLGEILEVLKKKQ